MIVVDYYTNETIKNKLKNYGEVVTTLPNSKIYEGIDAHPDILIRKLDKETIAVDSQNIEYYSNIFKNKKIIPIENIESPYPNHVKLNFAVYRDFFIHNLKFTDKEILNFYKNRGFKLIDVKQGYTKCNLAVGKRCLITSDVGIYEKLKNISNILLIEHKQIELRNFEYGFIGGATGLVGDRLFFTGVLEGHSSKDKIIKFLEANNENFEFLTESNIIDIGSIIEI